MHCLLILLVSIPMLIMGQDVALPEQCYAELAVGNCEEEHFRWYFNRTTRSCQWFTYSGCGGNANNFETVTECNHLCTCNLPAEKGRCRALFPMYHYNSNTGTCEQFIYGGCGGNANKFDTKDQCMYECVCTREKKTGPCRSEIPSFYYNAKRQKCESFTYGGCQGNVNRFSSMEACNDQCICNMGPWSGRCMAYFPSYYYDENDRQCKQFVYGGCGGNGNRFYDETTCMNTCHNRNIIFPAK